MAVKKSPSTEGLKQFARNFLVNGVASVLISLIAIFSLEQLEFLEAIKNPLTYAALAQMMGLFFLKDLVGSLGMGVERTMHVEGKNTGNNSLAKGLTRIK